MNPTTNELNPSDRALAAISWALEEFSPAEARRTHPGDQAPPEQKIEQRPVQLRSDIRARGDDFALRRKARWLLVAAVALVGVGAWSRCGLCPEPRRAAETAAALLKGFVSTFLVPAHPTTEPDQGVTSAVSTIGASAIR